MQRKIPRNIRQIGYANENERVYLEDYVDTYLNRLGEKTEQEKTGEGQEGAFLIGERYKEEGKQQTYIFGAVRMEGVKRQGKKIEVSEDAFEKAKKLCGEYFPEGEILGWFLSAEGCASGVDAGLIRQHEKFLPKPDTFLALQDPGEQETGFYIYRKHDFERLAGYYIYYEKNPFMQNYMIDERKGVSIEPQNEVVDAATRNFRQILKEKEEQKRGQSMHRLSYIFSTALVLIVLAMGIAAFNNYDGLAGAKSSIFTSSGNVETENDAGDLEREDAVRNASAAGNSDVPEDAPGDTAGESNEAKDLAGTDGTNSGDIALGSEKTNVTETPSGRNTDADDTGAPEEGKSAEPEEAGAAPAAETAEKSTDKSAGKGYYTVKKGDTLASISRKVYGNTSQVKEICSINGISNGDFIIEGQKILLP